MIDVALLRSQLAESVAYIRSQSQLQPKVMVILGSGLGEAAGGMRTEAEIPYASIPHFPLSTVKGHAGKLLLGTWCNQPVAVLSGRFHYYEGYSMQQVVYPLRVVRKLGAHVALITNASGGLNPDFRVGDLMVVTDHINLVSDHPLRGPNDDELGPRFPDQHAVYDKALIAAAVSTAVAHGIKLHQGVYVGVSGPTFETPAEYRFLRLIGGDAVGMSTVPEVMAANHMGMRVFCISVITDQGNTPQPQRITHEEVVQAARQAAPLMMQVLMGVLQHIE
ncbi:MAG: purine-nucleoside phosphorylase [Chitinophagales bacterium]|nr:purine-nucleoside phosphorylase [Chitinophagales bacterium]MDW8428544.1 purine-nucleoside phosphorylase [Chitinophagales bacterium]